jgi:hypothetical protein
MYMMMTKINEPNHINSSRRANRKPLANVSDGAHAFFADIMAMVDMATNVNEVASSISVSNVGATVGIDSMLAIQGVSSERLNKKQQITQANLVLDSLEELRMALLSDEIPHYLLTNIEKQMNSLKHSVNNPELREVIEDIELRAAVELAKFGFQSF